MPTPSITDQLHQLRTHFKSGATRTVESRIRCLTRLRTAILKYESDILAALHKDLHKNSFEAFGTEVGIVLDEIKHAIEELPNWAAPQSIATPLAAQPASSMILPQPRGAVLIISPWNYPFQLLFAPLVAAMAAGNVCVAKPSELAPHTSAVSLQIIREAFSEQLVWGLEGDAAVSAELLKHSWDYIFFTGSTRVGKLVAKAAAEHLTPYTLELGGKSPCIVDATARVQSAAKRIVWGKFINAGQTCVAPDYLLVHASVKDSLITEMKSCLRDFFGDDPQHSPDYGRIVNTQHFDRVASLITGGAIHGGRSDAADRYIEPTLIADATMDHPAMNDEIFGPVLPIITWNEPSELFAMLETHPNPLALYLFTTNQGFERDVLNRVAFGGGCINHTLLHLSSPDLPFGGIRQSGNGAYHGKTGFDSFTHYQSIVRAGVLDLPAKYPPYRNWQTKLIQLLYR